MPAIQAYFLIRFNGTHVDGRELAFFIASSCNKYLSVVCLGVHPPCCLYAYGIQMADGKGIDPAIRIYRVAPGIPGRYNLFSLIVYGKGQDIACCVFHDYVRCIRRCQLLQVGNSRFRTANQIFRQYGRASFTGFADACGIQVHILPLNVGLFTLGHSGLAALLVDDGVTDCIQQLFLCPGIRGMGVFFHNRLILRIRLQEFIHTCILGTILFGKHLFDGIGDAFTGSEQGKLLLHPGLVLRRILFKAGNVRAFVIIGVLDQPGVDPTPYQFIFRHVIGALSLGQRVQQTTIFCRQPYVPFPGNDGTNQHIVFVLLQINILLRRSVYTG